VIFTEYVAGHQHALLRFATALTTDEGQAEDVVQDVLARAYHRDHADQHADRTVLMAEIARLPRKQRAVLALRFYEGLTDSEIAETLGCTSGTVRGYASRALAQLRVQIAELPATRLTEEPA
jgi:DNA-directed RNA polymerase specialized sigma24 family protein